MKQTITLVALLSVVFSARIKNQIESSYGTIDDGTNAALNLDEARILDFCKAPTTYWEYLRDFRLANNDFYACGARVRYGSI